MKGEFIIKPLTAEHIHKAAVLERLCFSSPWSAKQLLESISAPLNIFLSAFSDGKLIGYIGFYRTGDEGFVTNLAVDPGHRRKGAGRALIRRLIKECHALGIRRITLETRKSNAPALALYSAEGFNVDGIRPGVYARPVEDALLLSRSL